MICQFDISIFIILVLGYNTKGVLTILSFYMNLLPTGYSYDNVKGPQRFINTNITLTSILFKIWYFLAQNNIESNKLEKASGSYKELQKFENMLLDSETSENSSASEYVSFGSESVNSRVTFKTSPSIEKEMIKYNQLIVLEPNNPVMVRFQNTLKQHLLKQKDSIKQELLSLVSIFNYKF